MYSQKSYIHSKKDMLQLCGFQSEAVIDEANEMISQISELNRVAARSEQLEQRVTELQGQVDHYRRICTASSSAYSSGGRGAGGRRVHSVGAVGSFTVPAVSTTHCHRSLVLSPSPLFSSLLPSCPLGVAKTQKRAVTERSCTRPLDRTRGVRGGKGL